MGKKRGSSKIRALKILYIVPKRRDDKWNATVQSKGARIRHATAWTFEALAKYSNIPSGQLYANGEIASEIHPVISKLLMHATLQYPNGMNWDWKMATLK